MSRTESYGMAYGEPVCPYCNSLPCHCLNVTELYPRTYSPSLTERRVREIVREEIEKWMKNRD